MGVEQLEWFPEATAEEVESVKSLLRRYPLMRRTVNSLSQITQLTPKQEAVRQAYLEKIEVIELSVNLIMDDEVKRIIEFRFIKGNPRRSAIIRFNMITDRTIDRKLKEGILSIANTLKIL